MAFSPFGKRAELRPHQSQRMAHSAAPVLMRVSTGLSAVSHQGWRQTVLYRSAFTLNTIPAPAVFRRVDDRVGRLQVQCGRATDDELRQRRRIRERNERGARLQQEQEERQLRELVFSVAGENQRPRTRESRQQLREDRELARRRRLDENKSFLKEKQKEKVTRADEGASRQLAPHEIRRANEAKVESKKQMEETLQNSRSKLQTALEVEFQEQVQAVEKRRREWPLSRLLERGLALTGLVARFSGTFFDKQVLDLTCKGKLDADNFSVGDLVVLSPDLPNGAGQRSSGGPSGVEGMVVETMRAGLKIEMPPDVASTVLHHQVRQNGMTWRVDVSVNTVTHERQMKAVEIITEPENVFLEVPQGSALQRVPAILNRLDNAEQRAGSFCPNLWKGLKADSVERMVAETSGSLNASQQEAITGSLSRTVTLWQGPPGTGKTHTLSALVTLCLQQRGGKQVLVCANTNVAVDNLVAGLVQAGVRVARIGSPFKVEENVRHVSLHHQVAQTEKGQRATELRAQSLQLREQMRELQNNSRAAGATENQEPRSWTAANQGRGSGQSKKGLAAKADKLWREADKLQKIAVQEVLDAVEVVACTCSGAGDPNLEDRSFAVCLPATVQSDKAQRMGLAVSLFERLMDAGLKPFLLATQYRMHPAISEFPSRVFYGGRLADGVQSQQRLLACETTFPWPNPARPVAFVQCSKSSEAVDAMRSYLNRGEARVVQQVVTLLQRVKVAAAVKADATLVAPFSVNVITPYRSQQVLLTGMLPDNVEVNTVDGFQGREADFVVISTVRTKSLGFTDDERRINVALTRARHGVVVIGDGYALERGQWWKKWLQWAEDCHLLLVDSELSTTHAAVDDRQPRSAEFSTNAAATSVPAPESPMPELAPEADPASSDHANPARADYQSDPSPPPPPFAESDISSFTVPQLKEHAKKMGLKGYSKLRKADLIALLREASAN
ncbi:hypothetical protein CYMTET_48111 [Cymbomonas tetramitiformis]|uniref:Rho termination factor-like N-terminal domain-containing protein n=1 Tax=Cymbomonas tetramitiformis TaxID=36881 RepID=A0AAE0BUT2_9CHLO|nr:hypothetical protein CYMTET_48111 [Cymbomonas tetramitiformis]